MASVDEGPGEHDVALTEDESTDVARCPRCGRSLWAYAHQCHHCGVQFRGEAWQGETEQSTGLNRWYVIAAILVLTAMGLSLWWWGK